MPAKIHNLLIMNTIQPKILHSSKYAGNLNKLRGLANITSV